MPKPHLPAGFVQRMETQLGADAPAFFAHYDQPPDAGLRVNTLKLTPAEFTGISPFALQSLPWTPAGYRILGADSAPGLHPFHAAGLYYLQEPSAQAVAEILDPQPGERVLDLAAAPGGKTTHLAAKMQNEGVLIANEIHPKRVWDLARNLERWGVRHALVANETPERLAAHFPAYFDRVLVDAPCSGEGMFRKMPEAVRGWSPEFVAGCAVRQSAILGAAARLVRPGGWLCYATCTFAEEEDELIISRFLDAHPRFELVTPPAKPGFTLSPLPPRSPAPQPPGSATPSAVRLWPHRAPGEGHFIALLRRREGGPGETVPPMPPSRGLDKLLPYWEQFRRASLELKLPTHSLRLVKSHLYAVPDNAPDTGRLHFVRPGWWLGSFKTDRFEPGHALAMALRPAEARRTLPLSPAETEAWLRREAVRAEGENGWTLVMLAGHFPLGWGKRVGGLVKNHYPAGVRIA